MRKNILQEMTEGKPPVSNTGAENTREGLKGLIDWFEFTLPVHSYLTAQSLLQIPSSEWIQMPKGLDGYKCQLRCGDISILYDGKPDMGVHVVMSGQGCREYEARYGDRWSNFIQSIFLTNGSFSRLDVAIDDYRGHFTLQHIVEKVSKHEVRTLFGRRQKDGSRRPFRMIFEPDFASAPGANDGLTVYGGSSKSKVMIRFYDKAVKEGVKFPWLRTEIQCRDKRADVMAKHIALEKTEIGQIAAGVLSYYVNFVEPCEDSNEARWPISFWWSEFLGCVDKVKLTIQKAVRTIEEKMEWVDRQMSPTLALISRYLDDKNRDVYDFFSNLIIDGEKRLKPRHLALLQTDLK